MNPHQGFCDNGNAGNLWQWDGVFWGVPCSISQTVYVDIIIHLNVLLTIFLKEQMVMSCLKTSMSH